MSQSLRDVARERAPYALERRDEVFRKRREVLAQLRDGSLDFDTLLLRAAGDKDLAKFRIVRVLQELPGWSAKKARRAVDDLGFDDRRTLGWLIGERGANALAKLNVLLDPPPPPTLSGFWPWWSDPEQSPSRSG